MEAKTSPKVCVCGAGEVESNLQKMACEYRSGRSPAHNGPCASQRVLETQVEDDKSFHNNAQRLDLKEILR